MIHTEEMLFMSRSVFPDALIDELIENDDCIGDSHRLVVERYILINELLHFKLDELDEFLYRTNTKRPGWILISEGFYETYGLTTY